MGKIYNILGLSGATLALFLAFTATASAATLSVSPSTKTASVGETFTVDILFDTTGQSIDGVDIQALNYNPYNLQIQDADSATSGTQIQPGTLLPTTLANSVDTVNGKIVFSQITNAGSTYTGNGKLASMTFKALVAGNIQLTFNFTNGATTDSNIASQGVDILTSVTNGQYIISNATTPTPPPTTPPPGPGTGSKMRLINSNGTYYLIINNVRHGITNPGMLYTYGFTFEMGKTATAQDMALPEGSLLTPNDGALVKSAEDPTVYLISGQKRYGFVSSTVYFALGFKFSSVLVVTNPELQALPRSSNLDNGIAGHLSGLDINRDGTVYWVGGDNKLHGYPSLEVYNSWHLPNDFTRVVPANTADMSLPVGDLVGARVLE